MFYKHYFFINISLKLSYFCKKMQKFWALGARPPDPLASRGRGPCLHTPFLRRLGASPPDPKTAPPMRISGYAPVVLCANPTHKYPNCLFKYCTFATTYLCKSGFSALVHIKKKARNQRKVKDDIRLALSSTKPRIPKLALWLHSLPLH